MLPGVFPHFGYANGVVGVDVDMLDFDIVFCHVHQHIKAGLSATKIVVQADEADLAEQPDHFHTVFIGTDTVVRAVGEGTLVV